MSSLETGEYKDCYIGSIQFNRIQLQKWLKRKWLYVQMGGGGGAVFRCVLSESNKQIFIFISLILCLIAEYFCLDSSLTKLGLSFWFYSVNLIQAICIFHSNINYGNDRSWMYSHGVHWLNECICLPKFIAIDQVCCGLDLNNWPDATFYSKSCKKIEWK